MTFSRIYIDHNATTPLCPEAVRAMSDAMSGPMGNPSSIHQEGRAAREMVERGRRQVADMLGADADEIVFTSGGTEADALGMVALVRLAARGGSARLLTTEIEHPAVRGTAAALAAGRLAHCEVDVVTIAVDENGRIDLEALARDAVDNGVLCISFANHEVGTVQDLKAIVAIARDAGMRVLCDGVQAVGKVAIDLVDLGVDAFALSAHKFYGPKGVGAVWFRRGLDVGAVIEAGHQERERRGGTENVLGIIGMGAAATAVQHTVLPAAEAIAALRNRLERGLLAIPGAKIHGGHAVRVCNTSNLHFPGAPGDAVVQALDLAGIAASTGAACTSGSVEPSTVIRGLGFGEARAAQSVRFSLGVSTTVEDIDRVVAVAPALVARARQFS